MRNIPLFKVFMPPKEKLLPALEATLYSGTVTEGNKVKEFEEGLQAVYGFSKRPLTTNSCTAALQLAYRACEVRDRFVLTTPMTCTATNMPILAEGGNIVWCDIDPSTGNISSDDIYAKIKQHGSRFIAAISFVDFAGYPADMDRLLDISTTYKIPLIEDAAQSIGARWNGKYVGLLSDYTAFSFQAIKQLTTGDGGALVVKGDKWDLVKRLKWYGINREAVKEATRWHYDIPDWGYKAHMNNINATIGIEQLPFISWITERHQANGRYFDAVLQDIDGLELLSVPPQSEPAYWIYMVKVKDRESFAKKMLAAGIGVNVAHIRNDNYSCFKNSSQVWNPNESRPGLEAFNDHYIAIPCGWWLTDEEVVYIAETIKNVCK